MELKYFDVFGKGEPIRMCLWKAGKEFKDTRLTFEEWGAWKAECPEFGQMPLLYLEDGTVLSQGTPILMYLGALHN